MKLDGLLNAFNGVTAAMVALYEPEIVRLEIKLADAMRFVPHPETMSGFMDPDAPDDVKELIRIAAKLHGRTLEEPCGD
jgi:hypothetical protein